VDETNHVVDSMLLVTDVRNNTVDVVTTA